MITAPHKKNLALNLTHLERLKRKDGRFLWIDDSYSNKSYLKDIDQKRTAAGHILLSNHVTTSELFP